MKFKMQDQQNQRIARISSSHLIIGVDIAQHHHVARAVNYRGIAFGKPLAFENNEEGFTRLLDRIAAWKEASGCTTEIVGMEPTGHYWLNLTAWLKGRQIDVVTVNPHLVKKNKENRDHIQSKSDAKDALVIADMVKNGYYSQIHPTSETFDSLRVLMANREVLVKRRVATINQLHRWVDIVFPELREVFQDLQSKGAIATLRLFPMPKQLRELDVADVIHGWKTGMKRHAGHRKAETLLAVAKRSVGSTQAPEAYLLHLDQLLEEWDLVTAQLERVEHEVAATLEHVTYRHSFLAIDGISDLSLAGILGEAGDIRGFAHGNALLRHAGLHLAEASSGKWKGQVVLSKRGRSRLRRCLYLATLSLIKNNADFRHLHHVNVQGKKMKKMKSVMKLMGKLARILVALARGGEPYCSEKVRPLPSAV
ncbi:IS110 family transposase [Alkalicoccus halolimnae]|uniref:IS110 family transposase n=1 Tax=Alkalicoccus halolimnae TaxID=1667239 RepID=A0AAJ8LU56_9BACI